MGVVQRRGQKAVCLVVAMVSDGCRVGSGPPARKVAETAHYRATEALEAYVAAGDRRVFLEREACFAAQLPFLRALGVGCADWRCSSPGCDLPGSG